MFDSISLLNKRSKIEVRYRLCMNFLDNISSIFVNFNRVSLDMYKKEKLPILEVEDSITIEVKKKIYYYLTNMLGMALDLKMRGGSAVDVLDIFLSLGGRRKLKKYRL